MAFPASKSEGMRKEERERKRAFTSADEEGFNEEHNRNHGYCQKQQSVLNQRLHCTAQHVLQRVREREERRRERYLTERRNDFSGLQKHGYDHTDDIRGSTGTIACLRGGVTDGRRERREDTMLGGLGWTVDQGVSHFQKMRSTM